MSVYLISYDLNASGQDYTDLFEKIKSLGTWWHNLDSTWVVKYAGLAKDIRNRLKSVMDKNDEFLVAELVGASAWAGFSDKASACLKNNL